MPHKGTRIESERTRSVSLSGAIRVSLLHGPRDRITRLHPSNDAPLHAENGVTHTHTLFP